MWVVGIEQMVEQRNKLTLPLNNHNYLRAIVYGIASDPTQVVAMCDTSSKVVKDTARQ